MVDVIAVANDRDFDTFEPDFNFLLPCFWLSKLAKDCPGLTHHVRDGPPLLVDFGRDLSACVGLEGVFGSLDGIVVIGAI
jgi:hypothetical protein